MTRAAVLLLVLGSLVAAPTASAATVSVKVVPGPTVGCKYFDCRDTLTAMVTAAPGERNVIEVERVDGGVRVRDAGAPLTAGSGCGDGGDGSVRCTSTTMVLTGTEVSAGDGDDRVSGAGILDGGAGDDVLTSTAGGTLLGGDGADVLTGSDGADRLAPGSGSDRASGGAGDDVVTDEPGPPAADVLDGGPGLDSLAFTDRRADVVVDLGPAGQSAGSAGEGNTVTGFEVGGGGSGDDRIRLDVATGSTTRLVPLLELGGGDDRLELVRRIEVPVAAGAGRDTLVGSPGKDALEGGSGADRIDGGAGADQLGGGGGADRVSGGKGADVLDGGTGADVLGGGAGNDELFARDRSRDRVSCGGGRRDRVTVDRRDRTAGCERIRRGR